MLTSMLQHVPAETTRLMPVLLDGALKGTAVLAVVWMIASRMGRWSAATRHLVWFVGLASLLVLPVLARALPAWRILPGSWDIRQSVSPSSPVVVPVAANPKPVPGEPQLVADWRVEPDPQDAVASARPPVAPAVPGTPAVPLGWWTWAALVWLVGAALLALRLLVGLACLVWASWRLPVCRDESWQAAEQQVCEDLGVGRRVRLLQGRSRTMPMTWGIFRSHLLVPADCGDWSPQRRRVVLLHELAHVKRWDCLTQLVAEMACAMLWFHPLVWLASKRMQNEAERACDDLVLARGSKPAEYAEHLLQIAASQHQGYLAAAMAAIPMARASKLEGRLLAILDGKRSRRALTVSAVILSLVVLAGVVIPVAMLRAGGNAAGPQATTPAAVAKSDQAVAHLPGGVTIEVAGVSYHPSEGKPWWSPEGTVGEQYAFVTSKGSIVGRDTKGREFVIQVRGGPEDIGITYHATTASGQVSGGVRPAHGRADGQLRYFGSRFPLTDETTTVRAGVAMGPWVTLAQAQAGGMTASGTIRDNTGKQLNVSSIFSPAFESDGGLGVSVTHTPAEGQVRIVAVDKDGQVHETGNITSGTAGDMSQTTAHFDGLSKSQVKSFRLQARPYQWIEFRNISLEPGHKTEVQVQIEPPDDLGPVDSADTLRRTPSELPTAIAPIPVTRPAAPAAPPGPPGEWSVLESPTGLNMFFDLDGGRKFTPPKDLKDKDAGVTRQWARAQGIDLQYGANDDGAVGLIGVDLAAVPVSEDAWRNGATEGDRAKLAAAAPGNVFLAYKPRTHPTWLFRTREGGTGILQIVAGLTPSMVPVSGGGTGIVILDGDDNDNPKGLRILYRLIGETAAKPPAESSQPVLLPEGAPATQPAGEFYVIGALRPGVYSLTRAVSVAQGVSAAGGPGPESKHVQLLRRDAQGKQVVVAAWPVESTRQSFALQAGDIVYISREELSTAWANRPGEPTSRSVVVSGDLVRPGYYSLPSDEDITLVKILAAAAVDVAKATNLRASIIRALAGGRSMETRDIQLSDVLQGKLPDPVLEPGDVIIVMSGAGPVASSRPTSQPVGRSGSVTDLSNLSQDKRRELAKRSASGVNMHQILRGLYTYVSRYNEWPDDLRTILDKGSGKTGDDAAQILTNPRWPDRKPGYIYIKPTVPINGIIDAGKTVALHEAYDEWGEGINVGFLDTHVTFMDNEAQFRDLLEHPAVVPAAWSAMRGNTNRNQAGPSGDTERGPVATQPGASPARAADTESALSPAEQRKRLLETYRRLTAMRIDAKLSMEALKVQYEATRKGGQEGAPLTPEVIASVEADPLMAELETRRTQLVEARLSTADHSGEQSSSVEEIDSRIQAADKELEARRLEKISQCRRLQMERAKLDLLAAIDQVDRIDQEKRGVEAAMEVQGIHLTSKDLRPIVQENLLRLGAMRTEAKARMEALKSQYEANQKAGIQNMPSTPEMAAAADADAHVVESIKQRSRILADRAVLLDRQRKGESVQQDLDRVNRRIADVDARIAETRLMKLRDLKQVQLERVRLDWQAALDRVHLVEGEYAETEAWLADLNHQEGLPGISG